jgi:hypothetical protein
MKRYTLVFRSAVEVEPAALRQAVEEALDRLHPRIVCRTGPAFRKDPRSIAVEISSEGKKEDIAQPLRAVEKKLPATLDRIAWGWDPGGPAAEGLQAANPETRPDPIAPAAPAGPAVFKPRLPAILARYGLFLLLSALLGISVFERIYAANSTLWEVLFVAAYLPWLFALTGWHLNPLRLARRIECGDGGIAVFYPLRRDPVRADWTEILGLDYSASTCILQTAVAPIRFTIGSGSGIREEKILLQTIVERAQLRFVEDRFRAPYYRRADAP